MATSTASENRLELAISKRRPLAGYSAKLVKIVAIAASVYHIIVLSNVLDYLFNWNVEYVMHRAVSLSFFVVMAFLIVPMRNRDNSSSIPWYDILFALVAFSGCAYVFLFYERELMLRTSMPTTADVVFGIITVITLLEVSRRVVGWFIPLLVVFFLLQTLYGNHFPGVLHNRGYPIERILIDLYTLDLGVWSSLLGVAATMIFMFVLFASFLRASGADRLFLNIALALGGRFRGGPAKVAVIGSALFGTLSGSAVANVAGTGAITIPMMMKTGFGPRLAAAIEAVASTGGMILPPVMGSVAFIMAEWLQVSYWAICVAAFVPAMLYFLCVFFMVHFQAARDGMRGLPKSELPSVRQALFNGWPLIIPLIVLVYFIGVLQWSPIKAVLFCIITLIAVGMLRKDTRMTWGRLVGGLEGGARGMIEVAVLCGTIGIMVGLINTTGIGIRLSGMLIDASGGNLFVLLLLTALTSYVLGMGLPTAACYILLASLVAPALIQAGVPSIAAHMFVLYYGVIANITPPACGAVLVGSAIAGSPMMRTGLEAMRLAMVAYIVPFIFVYNPALLAIGGAGEMVLAAMTAILGVILLASGIQGYLLIRCSWIERLFLVGSSLVLIVPGWQTDLAGLAVAVPVVLRQVIGFVAARRRMPANI